MSTQLDLIRNSDVATKKMGRGKHSTSDNSSLVALKRKIHNRVSSQAKKTTLFGMDVKGSSVKRAQGGDQSSYLFYKSIFPSMSLNSITKQ